MLSYLIAICFLLALLILTLAVFIYASGIFEHVCCEVRKPPVVCEASTYAYKVHDGPYAEAGYLFTEAYSVDSSCIQCAIKYEKNIDDDGPAIPSVVGSLIRDSDPACRNAFEKAGFTVTQLEPVEEALVASFPHISFLSIRIGAARAYGKMHAYILEHNLTVDTFIELYDGHWIHYIGLLKDSHKYRLPPPCESLESSVIILNGREDGDNEVKDADDSPDSSSSAVEPPPETLNAISDLPDHEKLVESGPTQPNGDSDEFEAEFEKITDASTIPTA